VLHLFQNPLESIIEVVLDPAAQYISVILILIVKPPRHHRLNTRIFITEYSQHIYSRLIIVCPMLCNAWTEYNFTSVAGRSWL